LNPSSLNLTKYGNLTVVTLSALTGAPLPNVNVVVSGPVLRQGVTDASGMVKFTNLMADVYRVNASATGYLPALATAVVEGGRESTVTVPLTPANAQPLPLPPGSNYTRPPILVNGTVYVPLMVKVQYKDGFPIQDANVTISTPSWTWSVLTGVDGTVLRYIPNNTAVTVTVSWKNYTETRKLTLTKPTSLFITIPLASGRMVPEVGVVMVATPPDWGPVMPVLVILVTNVPQNVTLEVGLLNETRRYPLLTLNVTLQPGTTPLSLIINATRLDYGVYNPYARIVKYQYDNATWNNEYIGKPVRMLPNIRVAVSVTVEVANFKGIAVIYPGVTVLKATISIYTPYNVTAKALGFNPRLRLNLTVIMPGEQPQKSILLDKELAELRKGMQFVVNFTLPRCRRLVLNVSMPMSSYNGSTTPEIPAHIIVDKYDLLTPAVKKGDPAKVKVKVWTNAWENETPSFIPVVTLADKTYRGKMVDLKPGTNEAVVEIPTTDVSINVLAPAAAFNTTTYLSGAPDAWSEDNYVKSDIVVMNTGSWVFWILAGIAVIIVLAIVLSLIKAIAAPRVVAYSSPYFEYLRR
ncbi:MAG: carboxypeptidase-like regulatory domain-containing protein, partial [Infirmifilum sp.]